MTDQRQKPSFNVAKAQYSVLMAKPKKDMNLIDLIAILVLEEYYPELRS